MDSSSLFDLAVDAPWFVHVAADPLLNLLELHPHLNVSALSPPANALKFGKNQLERRGNCYTFSNTNSTGNNNPTSSGPSGALIGGIIGGVVVVILLLVLAWFLWRRRRRQREQNQILPNTTAIPPGAMPVPYDPSHNTTPPMMQQTGPGGYDMNAGAGGPPGPNYTPAAYPAPPSSAGWSTTNASSNAPLTAGMANDRQSYYNYAPPPADPVTYPQQQPWNPTGAMYSNTPSPPPPSTTPGATSTHSGTTSGYAPWAIPHSSSSGPSVSGVASGSSSPAPPGAAMGMFPTAAEEKAHYSRNKEDEANKSRVGAPTPAPPAYDGPR